MKKRFKILFLALTAFLFVGGTILGALSFSGNSGMVKATDDVVDNTTVRVWIGDAENNTIQLDDAIVKVWVHKNKENSEAGSDLITPAYWRNTAQNRRTFFYFDVPMHYYTEQWYFTVQRFNPSDNTWWQSIATSQFSSERVNQVCYIHSNNWYECSYGSISSCDAGLAAKAIEGLYTCSSSSINGYNSFPSLVKNFIKDDIDGNEWKTVGNISDFEVNDFANDAEWNAAKEECEVKVNAWDKYLALENMYKANKTKTTKGVNFINDNALLYVTMCGLTTIASLSFIVIVKRKKLAR